MLSEFQLAMFEASGHMTPPQWSAVFAQAREAIRLKGLQHENSVLMQSRRTLIRLNDQYREALNATTARLERLVDGTAKLGGFHTYEEEVAAIARDSRAALTPEASHD